jgi:hypothetical protein
MSDNISSTKVNATPVLAWGSRELIGKLAQELAMTRYSKSASKDVEGAMRK